MLVIGSARAVNILISILRIKVVAVLLGPSGVGLLSIFNSLQGMVTKTAGLGMGQSGVREIAASRGELATLSRVRRVLFAAHLVQGALAMLVVWLLRSQIATWLFGNAARATEVGLIGVAILLVLLGAAQTALLQGLRKIDELGRVTVIGAFMGTVAGLSAVWVYGESGLIWFVLVQPLAAALVAMHYTLRLPKPTTPRLSLSGTWAIWKPMAKLGTVFMLGGLATTATLLLVRGRISQELGLDAAGHFAAAWSISMTYVGFLLSAMSADYFPRLTENIHDLRASVRLINVQAQLVLAIGGPTILLLIGLAPWLITLLYSAEFEPAVALLQWQLLGNVFKLAGWSVGFAHVAAGRGKIFLSMQLVFNVVFLLVLWPLLETMGVVVAGPAFLLGYLVGLVINVILVRHYFQFRWESLSLSLLGLHAGLAAALLALALAAPVAAGLVSPLLAAITGLLGLRVVLIKIGPEGRLAGRFARFFAAIGWPLKETHSVRE
ncbi:O-antigen translocase [bacterium]|nr:O-antigen translocase [bacterium]